VRNGVDLVEVRVPHEITDPETLVKYYQQAMDQASCRVKGLLFCNPQNPRAQIYPPSIIQALLRFCEEKDIHFISDEIYALSTFGSMDAVNPANTDGSDDDCKKQVRSHVDKPSSNTFTSVLQIDLEKLKVNPARVHMLYGISKDFGCSGLRLVRLAHG
jgi:gliotoxin/aspirochlorine biosynthesis aminotransferase